MGLDRNVIGTRDEVLLQLKDATRMHRLHKYSS